MRDRGVRPNSVRPSWEREAEAVGSAGGRGVGEGDSHGRWPEHSKREKVKNRGLGTRVGARGEHQPLTQGPALARSAELGPHVAFSSILWMRHKAGGWCDTLHHQFPPTPPMVEALHLKSLLLLHRIVIASGFSSPEQQPMLRSPQAVTCSCQESCSSCPVLAPNSTCLPFLNIQRWFIAKK